MATYTSSLGLELITPGSQAGLWGNTTNNTFTLVDQAITGVTPISFAAASGTTYTLTDFNGAVDEARSAVLNITGTATGSNTVVIPNKQKTYLVRNNTGKDVVFQTASPNATYTVGAGYSILIFCDGNNNVFTGIAAPSVGTLLVNAGGTGTTTFGSGGFVKSTGGTNALTSALTVNAGSEISGVLPVTNGGTGVVSLINNGIMIGKGTGAVESLVGGSAGQVATWNGSIWVAATPSSAGVTSISGSGINVSPATGAVTITLTSGNVTGALGYTPPSVTGSGASGTWAINISGNAATATSAASATNATDATNANSLGGVAASGYVTTSEVQTISGAKTFSSTVNFNGTTTSSSWYVASGARMYWNSANSNIYWDINSGVRMKLGPVGNFEISGSLAYKASGTTWDNPSDVRLKENIQDYTKGLTELVQINPKTWTFNGKGGSTSGLKGLGVIADEVESVIPDSVKLYKAKMNPDDATETDIKRFNADEIIWILVNSVKQLKAEVDALKAAK